MKKLESNTEEIRKEKALAVLMQTGSVKEKDVAFAKLHARHKDAVLFEALKAFKMNQDIAHDIVQEIFIKAFLSIGSFNPEFAFSTWLYTITKNHIIDTKRKTKVEVLHIENLNNSNQNDSDDSSSMKAVFQIEDKSANNHELMVRQERADILREAIASIKNEKAKNVINNFCFLGKSHEEISKEMKLPIGTVKALIFRAKDSIKEYLSKTELDFTY